MGEPFFLNYFTIFSISIACLRRSSPCSKKSSSSVFCDFLNPSFSFFLLLFSSSSSLLPLFLHHVRAIFPYSELLTSHLNNLSLPQRRLLCVWAASQAGVHLQPLQPCAQLLPVLLLPVRWLGPSPAPLYLLFRTPGFHGGHRYQERLGRAKVDTQ